MKEQLISFETAKLAKEKGFDVEQERYYTDEETKFPFLDEYFSGIQNSKPDVYYNAPTQSLLQKWLREIHKIDIYIIGFGFGYFFQLNNVPPGNQENVKYIDRRYNTPFTLRTSYCDTYEEALEEALKHALNLIK